jgi:hypothetical protein
MHRALYFVPGLLIFLSLPAFAATVDSVKGKVLINRGEGFQQVTSGTQANAGDRLMAGPGASAKLVYSDRCQISVVPGRVVSVGKQPPCTAQSLVGEDYREGFFSNPVPPFAITAAIGWGIFCATTYCRDHHEGGGRRVRRDREEVEKPASP